MAPKRKATRLNPDATPTPVTNTHTTTSVTNAQIQAMINEGIIAALAASDATRNGDDSHTSGTGARRPVQVARECSYPDFLKCQPLNFKGTEGVVGLTQWFEKMESVYSISNCTVACQVKFATCTLQGNALTWWNSHVKTTTPEAAHAMPWRTLKKMMTDKYCPRGEIKKLEFEMWNLKVKGNDVVTYSQRFQELALMCDRMFPEEIDQVEKYVGGLPDTIHGSVMATKPKTMQDAIEFATELMDKKINTWAERQADNKRKSDDTARSNQNQQPNKRQNTEIAYATGNGDRRPYGGPKPLCKRDVEMRYQVKIWWNDESKKMQKYILKQHLRIQCVSTEDANQKFLRSLPSAWLQVSLIMRNKPGMDSLSFDDLYNNLRVFENDVKGSTASSSNLQNIAFVSENTSSTKDVSTDYGVSNTSGHCSKHEQTSTSSYSLLASQSSSPQLDHEDLDQVDEYDLEEMDLKWQVAMISMRIKKFYKKTGRKLHFDAKEPVGFDKTKVECYNCHKTGHFARECRTKEDNRRRDGWNTGNKDGSRTGKKEESKALVTVDGESVGTGPTHSED
ncbi:putative reverse transcriptase domain-containing protein [Tanacetum coccineum]|uniref:Reverse transcriptase domain-containing protein n=1 Tax=Tanacetum coccineum TaxID=301880 RepID=A0ABQ4Z364_9ASTR